MRLSELAEELGARLEGDGEVEISSVAPLEEAGEGDLSFLANPKYKPLLESSRAAAVILGPGQDAGSKNCLRVDNPYAAFVRVLTIFDRRPQPVSGVDERAAVDDSAEIGEGCHIGPYAVVGAGARIGAGSVIHPHVVIYPGAVLGRRCVLHAGAVLRELVELGDGVVLQPGAVVGGDGFGFLPMGDRAPLPIPQIGTVSLGDGVELGANSTVDRAAAGATRLEPGVKIDNLVMIAHGCRIGSNSMIAAQTGLAGSTRLGARVMVGGQVGIGGHLRVGDDAQLAAQCGVMGDLEGGKAYSGTPAVDIGVWRRYAVLLAKLPDLFKMVRRLAKARD